MNRERAETHLRLLAEADLRRAPALTADDLPGERLRLVVEALSAVDAVDVGTADDLQAELRLALAVRQPGQVNETSPGPRGLSPDARIQLARLMHSPPPRAATEPFAVSGLSTGHTQPASQRASWRLVPVGKVIRIRDNEFRGEMLLLVYAQTAGGARFTVAGWPFGRVFTAADDQGTRYHLVFRGESGAGVLKLHPDPLREIRWLDFTTTSGEPATRIDLGSQIPAPDVMVTRKANSPGELLLDVIAARLLTIAAAFAQDTPEQLAAARPGLVPHAADTRQQRPLAHHAHERLQPPRGHRRGRAVAGDRAPAGSRNRLDRCGRRRAIGGGPGQAAAPLEVKSSTVCFSGGTYLPIMAVRGRHLSRRRHAARRVPRSHQPAAAACGLPAR